ncbi:hypothetical protein D5S17_18225 [Pseudonocardiaceae bacterium YIM PH 21723]|nr:hypothetical protein D5S17_18225 [Pseudonocardiaceae bacterium YIM PH 21723]
MDLTVVAYLLYLAISIGITLWVGQVLHRHGRRVLAEAYEGRENSAESVSQLLMIGFYLVNFGLIALYLRIGDDPLTGRAVIEGLATKIGVVLLVVGAIHMVNIALVNRVRRARAEERMLQEMRATAELTRARQNS